MSIEHQQQWLQTALGNYLQAQEQALFDHAASDVFGFNAVQVGMLQMDFLRNSRMPFCVKTDTDGGAVHCDPSQLPFMTASIDLLQLPHVLEFSENPHQTLREAERVLVPEGHIMISGFNPISTWGLKRLAAGREGYPWDGNFLPLLRIKDWLALLGFELMATRMACYAPPCRNPAWLGRFRGLDKAGDRWWPMMGGIYFIVAKKRVLGMRLIRPNWQAAKLKPRLVATPSQKNDMKTDGQ
ncbi:MAG TPA: methyltransferase domain-containing protein [Methylophilaceae bacterium]|nr:methyltransferase domain-containing protein [Methylophilaceae bacterium]